MVPSNARLSPYLKGLADTRARADARVTRLQERVPELQALAALYERRLRRATDELQRAKAVCASCDQLIRTYSAQLEPERIAPVNGRRGRYGKRGALRDAVLSFIRDAGTDGIATPWLAERLIVHFGLEFSTPLERKAWVGAVLRVLLRKLEARGLLERDGTVTHGTRQAVVWRTACARGQTLEALALQAAQLGQVVALASGGADHEGEP